MVLPLCFLLAGCAAKQDVTVDIRPYVSLTFDGQDGEGTAVAALNTDALTLAVQSALGFAATPEDAARAAAISQAIGGVQLHATPESGLTNGDSVTAGADIDPDALQGSGLNLVFTPFTVEVTGLQEVAEVDPFANVTVSWQGFAPEISMVLSLSETAVVPWSWISYTSTVNTGLSGGDTVTLTAQADSDMLARLGYRLSGTERTYTVPDALGSYLFNWNELDAEAEAQLLQKLQLNLTMLSISPPKSLLLRQSGADLLTLDDTMHLSDFAFDSAWFLSAQDEKKPEGDPGWYNALVCVYCFNITTENGDTATAYSAFALPNIATGGVGTVFQSDAVVAYRTADTVRDSLSVVPGAGYRAAQVSFSKAATLESAAN